MAEPLYKRVAREISDLLNDPARVNVVELASFRRDLEVGIADNWKFYDPFDVQIPYYSVSEIQELLATKTSLGTVRKAVYHCHDNGDIESVDRGFQGECLVEMMYFQGARLTNHVDKLTHHAKFKYAQILDPNAQTEHSKQIWERTQEAEAFLKQLERYGVKGHIDMSSGCIQFPYSQLEHLQAMFSRLK